MEIPAKKCLVGNPKFEPAAGLQVGPVCWNRSLFILAVLPGLENFKYDENEPECNRSKRLDTGSQYTSQGRTSSPNPIPSAPPLSL